MIEIRSYQQSLFKEIYLAKIFNVVDSLSNAFGAGKFDNKIRPKGVRRSYHRKLRKLLRPFSVKLDEEHDSATYRTNREKAEETYWQQNGSINFNNDKYNTILQSRHQGEKALIL